MAGLQCHKQLWWRIHEPKAPELTADPWLQNRFDQSKEVGLVARTYVPGAQYEASFASDEAVAVVDILEPGRSPVLIEVKATNSVKKEHIPDVAIQVHVLRQAGVAVPRAEVMHLNPRCRFPKLDDLFVREDVTEKVELFLPVVPGELQAQQAMLAGPLPDVPIGEHCARPHKCPFLKRCWPGLPEHHVSTLYTIQRRKVEEYQAQGFDTIHELPSDLELSVIHARQVKAVTTGQMVVEPKLASALAEFASSPLAYLDFETVSYAIPRFPGCRPWENMPVQFSVHREGPPGGQKRFTHSAYLADGPDDPRPAIAEQVVKACAGATRIVAYYASFERECLRNLAEGVPHLAAELLGVGERLVDLLPLVRNHIYHPDFGGSFSIKKVLPALVPGLSYADLAINEGETATLQLMRLLFEHELKGEERAKLRRALLAYCERDTWAMVKLLERIRGLVGSAQLELF